MKSKAIAKILGFLSLLLLLNAGARAGLSFEKSEIRHEAQPTETSYTANFKFKNTGSDTVKIEKILTSCNCTAAELEKKTYEAGESGEVKVTFTYGDRSGEQMKKIQVITNEKPRGYALDLIVNIPRLINVSPPFHSWDHGMDLKSLPFTINLSSSANLKIQDISLENPDKFSGRLEEIKPGVSYRYHVTPTSTQEFTKSLVEITVELPGGETKGAKAFVLVKPGPPKN